MQRQRIWSAPKLVWLIPTGDLNESGRELGNEAVGDGDSGSSPGLIAIQEHDHFLEVVLQKFLLPE